MPVCSSAHVPSVHALLAAIDARDGATGQHSKGTEALAIAVACELDVGARDVRSVGQVGLLHDVGKIGVSDRVLRKAGPLDKDEWDEMRRHSEMGEQIVQTVPDLSHLAPAIRGEHERWDGEGYPDGLAGEDVPLASRIVLASDAYVAMTELRPYRVPMRPQEAQDELRRNAGSQFDPKVAEALLAVLAERA
jgi:HD-GYP domain-containing protein (c-di-GMP phosphodiesterase class II)